MRLFLDTNVTLDVLARREPWLHDSATVLSLLEADEFDGIVAAHSITTLHYLAVKELGRGQATAALVDLLKLVSVAPLDQETILEAIALGWRDFEDAIQMLSASAADADYLVTRNARRLPEEVQGATVGSARGPNHRRRAEDIAKATSRRGNDRGGPLPPQPKGGRGG